MDVHILETKMYINTIAGTKKLVDLLVSQVDTNIVTTSADGSNLYIHNKNGSNSYKARKRADSLAGVDEFDFVALQFMEVQDADYSLIVCPTSHPNTKHLSSLFGFPLHSLQHCLTKVYGSGSINVLDEVKTVVPYDKSAVTLQPGLLFIKNSQVCMSQFCYKTAKFYLTGLTSVGGYLYSHIHHYDVPESEYFDNLIGDDLQLVTEVTTALDDILSLNFRNLTGCSNGYYGNRVKNALTHESRCLSYSQVSYSFIENMLMKFPNLCLWAKTSSPDGNSRVSLLCNVGGKPTATCYILSEGCYTHIDVSPHVCPLRSVYVYDIFNPFNHLQNLTETYGQLALGVILPVIEQACVTYGYSLHNLVPLDYIFNWQAAPKIDFLKGIRQTTPLYRFAGTNKLDLIVDSAVFILYNQELYFLQTELDPDYCKPDSSNLILAKIKQFGAFLELEDRTHTVELTADVVSKASVVTHVSTEFDNFLAVWFTLVLGSVGTLSNSYNFYYDRLLYQNQCFK
jgi:hypothetical protein